jgi:nitrite reductase/ring-hydroxylating ferredoxin subunit
MWKRVCDRGAVPDGGMKQFELDTGLPILIVNAGGEFFAYQAFCPHEQVKLEDGVHDGSILTRSAVRPAHRAPVAEGRRGPRVVPVRRRRARRVRMEGATDGPTMRRDAVRRI